METIEFDLQIEWEEDPLGNQWEEVVNSILLGTPDPRLSE